MAPSVLGQEQYYREAMSHRFCVVAPGDDPSTRKLPEAVAAAAAGGCLPLIVAERGPKGASVFAGLPYTGTIDYCAFAFVIDPLSAATGMRGVLDRLESLPEQEIMARRRGAVEARTYFVYNTTEGDSAAEHILGEMCAVARERCISAAARRKTKSVQRLCPP